jgi:hypothetical protein
MKKKPDRFRSPADDKTSGYADYPCMSCSAICGRVLA